MYNIILFDLDGTIIDSAEAIQKSAEYALRQVGITDINSQKLYKLIGPPLDEGFKKLYGLDDIKTFQAIWHYRRRYEKYGIDESKLYDGAKEMIKKLHQKGKILYIATLKVTYLSKKIIDHFTLAEYFTDIVGATMDYTRSKKADIISYIVQKYPKSPKNSFVMVGDNVGDILGAHEHGIDSIGVTYGYGAIEEIKKAKPIHIAHSVNELEKILIVDNNQSSLL